MLSGWFGVVKVGLVKVGTRVGIVLVWGWFIRMGLRVRAGFRGCSELTKEWVYKGFGEGFLGLRVGCMVDFGLGCGQAAKRCRNRSAGFSKVRVGLRVRFGLAGLFRGWLWLV